MRSNLGRLACLACTLPLLIPCGVRAGYDLTLSMSDSDPHANVSMTPVGIDTLYLWLNCSEQGASALDATLEGDIVAFGFSPASGIVNAGTFPRLLLGIGGCPAGEDVDVLLGTITVWDSSASGGGLHLEASSGLDDVVIVSCDSTLYSYEFIPRAAGFASGGAAPDTTGSEHGCGVFPSMNREPVSSLAYEWSPDYDEPGVGEGADAPITLIRTLSANPNTLIVGGQFSQVDALSVPNLARLTLTRAGGAVSTAWDLPAAWGGLSPLATSYAYLGADQDPSDGSLLVGSDDPAQPLAVVTSSGVWTDAPPMHGTLYSRQVRAIEHWSGNGKFLVAGDFQSSGSFLGSGDFHGLAQYDPDSGPLFGWEPFGYPISSDFWYVENDGFSAGAVDALHEVRAPGRALDGAILVGGRFRYVFGASAGPIYAANCAWLDPSDGSFDGLFVDAPVYTMAQSPEMAVDGGLVVYFAGDFGTVEGSEGLERASVLMSDFSGTAPGALTPITPGSFPYPGPFTDDAFTSAMIYKLVATRDHLYAIGDFDRVLPARGSFAQLADGFARFSFDTGRWESLGWPVFNEVPRTAAVAWPAVLVGGDFTAVHDVAWKDSYRVGLADFGGGATDVRATDPGLPRGLRLVTAPNPFGPGRGIQLTYTVPRETRVKISVHDVAGREVLPLFQGLVASGPHTATWAGKDLAGRACPGGVYFVRLTDGLQTESRKVTLVR